MRASEDYVSGLVADVPPPQPPRAGARVACAPRGEGVRMKAARWYKAGDICVEDVPECQIDEDYDVKVKLHWCGIFSSDLHEYLTGPIFILPFVSWPSIT